MLYIKNMLFTYNTRIQDMNEYTTTDFPVENIANITTNMMKVPKTFSTTVRMDTVSLANSVLAKARFEYAKKVLNETKIINLVFDSHSKTMYNNLVITQVNDITTDSGNFAIELVMKEIFVAGLEAFLPTVSVLGLQQTQVVDFGNTVLNYTSGLSTGLGLLGGLL